SRTAGKRRPNRRGRPSGRREADRRAAVGGRGPWRGLTRVGGRFGGGRLAGGNEAEGGDQCDEQGGADQRRVPHISSPAKRRTRPRWWCTAISAAKGVEGAIPRREVPRFLLYGHFVLFCPYQWGRQMPRNPAQCFPNVTRAAHRGLP